MKQELRSYVFRNVLSTVGLSIYILADTLFIANGVGALGLTSLNLALPLFNLLNSLGLLLGMGGVILFSIEKSREPEKASRYFSQLGMIAVGLGLFFFFLGLFFTDQLALLLGSSPQTFQLTTQYLKIILLASPFFILNNFCISFVRNDNNPHLTMVAMLSSCLLNIILDYLFMFPFQMGMQGAALATAISPIVSLAILTFHRKEPTRLLRLVFSPPQGQVLFQAIKLGFPSFLTEIATGISILFFNFMLLTAAGDIGVAAYGILANIQLVGLAIFTGCGQGIQPIVSREYGKKAFDQVKEALFFGLRVSFGIAVFLYAIIILFKNPIIQLFVDGVQPELVALASDGLPIFLTNFFFASFSLVWVIFFAAINQAKASTTLVLLRGYFLLIPLLLLLGSRFGLTGIWLSLPLTEALTFVYGLFKTKKIFATYDHFLPKPAEKE